MKKIIAFICLVLIAMSLISCGNKDMWDTVYTFDKAIIDLGNGTVIEGKVDTWTDYEDGDQIQVKVDGRTYLVHSENITLIAE